MRLILTLILCLPLMAQFPVELMRRPTLNRSGMAAGVQTGSGNLLLQSASFATAPWVLFKTSFGSDTLTAIDAGSANRGINQVVITSAGNHTATVRVSAGTAPTVTVMLYDISTSSVVASSLYTFATSQLTTSVGSGVAVDAGGGLVDISVTGSFPAAGSDLLLVYLRIPGGAVETDTVKLYRAQLNPGSTALPYVATTDLQSIASLPPGTATLVRGANTGASTDDPVVSLAGWTFDGVNDLASGLPAKGNAWTTINCNATECHVVTSAGTKYINGVASEDAAEWDIGTAGGYTGLLTWWGRKNRVIGPGEALNDYRGYIRPTVNARGNTLP